MRSLGDTLKMVELTSAIGKWFLVTVNIETTLIFPDKAEIYDIDALLSYPIHWDI